MADLKISALTAATTPLAGTEVLPIVQGGVTTKVAVSDLTAGRAVTAASVNKVVITAPATASTLTIADGKTLAVNDNATLGTGGLTLGNSGGFTAAASKVLTASNTLTLAGTDATTQTFPATSATIARTDAAQTFTGDQTFSTLTDGQITYAGASGLLSSDTGLTYNKSTTSPKIGLVSTSTYGAGLQISGAMFFIGSDNATPVTLKTNGSAAIILSTAQAVRFPSYGAGTLTTDASGNITAISDESMKSNIRPFTRGLSEILCIASEPNGVILYGYTLESGLDQTKSDYAGWSAQIVQKYIPEAVGKMPDQLSPLQTDDEGNVIEGQMQTLIKEGCLTLNTQAILAAVTNAIAELNNKFEAYIASHP